MSDVDIQVGDRITYIHDVIGVETIEVIYDLSRISTLLFEIEKGKMKILKIERPKYEVVEEKKEVLTEEEKEFLKDMCKYYNNILSACLICENGIQFYDKNCYLIGCIDYPDNMKFDNIKKDKRYTLEELRLKD